MIRHLIKFLKIILILIIIISAVMIVIGSMGSFAINLIYDVINVAVSQLPSFGQYIP